MAVQHLPWLSRLRATTGGSTSPISATDAAICRYFGERFTSSDTSFKGWMSANLTMAVPFLKAHPHRNMGTAYHDLSLTMQAQRQVLGQRIELFVFQDIDRNS